MKTTYLIRHPKENILDVVSICKRFPQKTTFTNGEGYSVDAKSSIGAEYAAAEWKAVQLDIEEEILVLELLLKQKDLVEKIF